MEIRVLISGLILLVSSNAFMDPGTDVIRSALVVNASKPFDSAYDVDIPVHEAVLSVLADEVATIIDPESRVSLAAGGKRLLRLNGDHLEFGTGGGNCKPLHVPAVARDSTATLPKLSEIIGSQARLRDGTFPTGADADDFTLMKADAVLAWLDLTAGGSLRAKYAKDQQKNVVHDEVEFRPSRRKADLAPAVEWSLDAGTADCLVITPFSGGSRIVLAFKKDRPAILTLRNTAMEDSGEVIPGIGYDYEILYSLLRNRPPVPPIPYSVTPHDAKDGHVHGVTGVNCGPPKT